MKEENIYQGLITALITPFKDNKIDSKALERLIALQIEADIKGVVIGGTTGEGSSLGIDEYYDLIKAAYNFAAGRTNIIAGFAAASTSEAVAKVKALSKLGINGIMCTVPHYIRPQQEGLVMHFKAVSEATDLPLMMYIHPGRTGVDLMDESILELADCRHNIVAIKDAGGDMERVLRLLSKGLPPRINMLAGDDGSSLAYSANGGRGCVSVVSNILPSECRQLQNYLTDGDYTKARELQQKLTPVYKAIFIEPNPVGIKCAAYLMGLGNNEIRLPLVKAKPAVEESIKKILGEFGKI